MKWLLELINSSKSGWYSGKGFKASRKENYEKALYYYDLALKYNKNDIDPVIYDSIAIALYKLNRYEESLIHAKKSFKQYLSLESEDLKIHDRIKMLKKLVRDLENNKTTTQQII